MHVVVVAEHTLTHWNGPCDDVTVDHLRQNQHIVTFGSGLQRHCSFDLFYIELEIWQNCAVSQHRFVILYLIWGTCLSDTEHQHSVTSKLPMVIYLTLKQDKNI